MLKSSLILEGLNNIISFKKEKYSWGILRNISMGNRFSIIIHPENWDTIINVIKSGESDTFRDEQKYIWNVSKVGDKINLSSKGNKVSIDIKDLTDKLE